ncbi:MAG TPA: hypothetical protein VNL91_03280, partial [Thermoanaerobaculia bacterium]|nr:hypothetical protein [Thermoanaerobaculia bacterium]
KLPEPGSQCRFEFECEGRPVRLDCVVVRTEVERAARTEFEKTLYHSGLEIVGKDAASEQSLRHLIEECVTRALDEQRANARGIPAIAAQSFQTGKASEFIRCEFLNGKWRSSRTSDPEQPKAGFTVSADEEVSKIEMLRSAYESADDDGKKLIRTFAALSISKAEGIPTRRYNP